MRWRIVLSSIFMFLVKVDWTGSEWIEQGDAFDRIWKGRDIDAVDGILTFTMISFCFDLPLFIWASPKRSYFFWISSLFSAKILLKCFCLEFSHLKVLLLLLLREVNFAFYKNSSQREKKLVDVDAEKRCCAALVQSGGFDTIGISVIIGSCGF